MTKTRRVGFSRKRRRGGRKTLKRRGGRRRSRVIKRGGKRRSRVSHRRGGRRKMQGGDCVPPYHKMASGKCCWQRHPKDPLVCMP